MYFIERFGTHLHKMFIRHLLNVWQMFHNQIFANIWEKHLQTCGTLLSAVNNDLLFLSIRVNHSNSLILSIMPYFFCHC